MRTLRHWNVLRFGRERVLELYRRDLPGNDRVDKLHAVCNWTVLVGYGSCGIICVHGLCGGQVVPDRRELVYHVCSWSLRLSTGFVELRGLPDWHVLNGGGLGMHELCAGHLSKRPWRLAVRAMRNWHFRELYGRDELIGVLYLCGWPLLKWEQSLYAMRSRLFSAESWCGRLLDVPGRDVLSFSGLNFVLVVPLRNIPRNCRRFSVLTMSRRDGIVAAWGIQLD